MNASHRTMDRAWLPSKRSRRRWGVMLSLVPIFILIVGVLGYPLVSEVSLSLFNQSYIGVPGQFVGLDNFRQLLLQSSFWNSLLVTVEWTAGNVVVQGVLGLPVALLLKQRFWGRSIMRILIIIPWVLPDTVVATLWQWMLSSSFGIINHLLLALHLVNSPITFLGGSLTMPTLVGVNSWEWFPFGAILLYAALGTVPEELYEAAIMDGANAWKRFRYVSLPWIQHTLITLGLVGMVVTFNNFTLIWLMSRGGPGTATETLPLSVYETAFQVFQVSQGAAIGVLTIVSLAVLAGLFLKANARGLREFM